MAVPKTKELGLGMAVCRQDTYKPDITLCRAGASGPAGPVLARPILREKVGVFVSRLWLQERSSRNVVLSSNNVLFFAKQRLGNFNSGPD